MNISNKLVQIVLATLDNNVHMLNTRTSKAFGLVIILRIELEI